MHSLSRRLHDHGCLKYNAIKLFSLSAQPQRLLLLRQIVQFFPPVCPNKTKTKHS